MSGLRPVPPRYAALAMISNDTRFTPASAATVKALDDRGVVVDMRSGKCWELNPVGFAIWTLVAGGASAADASAAIAARYAVAPGTSQTDVFAFLGSLVDAGLLLTDSGGGERNGTTT